MDPDSTLYVDAEAFLARRHQRPLNNSATKKIAEIMTSCSSHSRDRFGRGYGRRRGCFDGRRQPVAVGRRPYQATSGDCASRALSSACNKLSHGNFDTIYPIILGFVKTVEGTVTFLIRRGSESGSYAELYVRMFKKLTSDGFDDKVRCGLSEACAAFVQGGCLHVAPLVDDENYDDFCRRLLAKRHMLSLIQILCSDTTCAQVVVPAVLKNFSQIMEHPESTSCDLAVDSVDVVIRMCPKWRVEARGLALAALTRGSLDSRTRFKVMDVIDWGNGLCHNPL